MIGGTRTYGQGPLSRAILSQLTEAPLDNDAFPFSTARAIKVAGHDVTALRLTFIGEMGCAKSIQGEDGGEEYLYIKSRAMT
jgi:glycine cleavage system aminomethyltransferase T